MIAPCRWLTSALKSVRTGAASWQHVACQHSRYAINCAILGADAVGGGEVGLRQDGDRWPRGQGAAGVEEHDLVAKARGERQVVQRHEDGAAAPRKRDKVM